MPRMNRSLLFAIAVIAFVGVFFAPGGPADHVDDIAPANPSQDSQGNPFMVTPAATASQVQANALGSSPVWSGGDTTLTRSGDGHFYANVRVGGMPVNFMVDTGASIVALTASDARALGLSWNEADIRPIGHGASGQVMGVPVMLDRVELDDHRADNVAAVIIPEGLRISLLGQSFLSAIPRVQIQGQTMVMGR